MSEEQKIRVVIADDQKLVRAGFAMVISSQPDMAVVGQARDGAEAVALAETLHPDVVLMDVRMPGMDGIEAARRISALQHRFAPDGSALDDAHTRVIILTTFDLDEYVMAAINAGASGFLLKDSNEVALPEDMAKQLNVGIGDTVRLTSQYAVGTDGKAKADNVRVVGLTSDPNGAYSYYGGAIVGSDNLLAAMQGTDDFDTTGTTTVYLDLALDGNSVSAKTINSVKALLPKHFDLMSRQQVSDESIKSLTGNQTSIVTTFLMCFGVLAMFVAALVIANTFQVLVAQRRRTLALLRTIGAKKGQLYGSVLFEAAVLGFVASVLGVVLGSLLMWGMCVSNIMQEGMRFNFSWQAAVIPILFGIVVTVLASLGSARSATAVTPLEALRPIELTDNRRSSLTRAIIGILMVVVGIAMRGEQTVHHADIVVIKHQPPA